MNAFEDFSAYVKTETAGLYEMLSKHTEMVNTVKSEHDKNKFEEGNFNRVSIIKKQDETIKTLEIKVAELEMRLASADKLQQQLSANTVEQSPKPVETHLCYARIGKAKYNISKQVPEFMDDFPMGTYVTKTGCVVGLSCKNIVQQSNVLFCPEHNTGKFEDIRTEPGSPQTSVVSVTVTTPAEPLPEKKKATGRKKKEAPVSTETVEAPVPVETPAPEQPLTVETTTPEQPLTVETTVTEQALTVETTVTEQPLTVETTVTEQPLTVETTVTEQPLTVETTVTEQPLTVETTVTETVPVETTVVQDIKIPPLTIPFGEEDTQDDVSPPMSPIVDIATIKQTTTTTSPKVEEPSPKSSGIDDAVEPPSFDDIEFYDDPVTGKTYYLDSKTRCIYEIAPNDEIGVFVKRL
jgi:hypothetical protein